MIARLRRLLVLLLKLAVTTGLLAWVVSGVHWRDYVVEKGGREVRVLDRRGGRVLVASGARPQWHALSDFQPLRDQYVRPGMAAALADIDAPLFLLAAAMIAMQLVLMGVRWWYLLRMQDVALGLGAVLRLMFIGHFFNFFLPGSTGGDVLRAVLITKRTNQRTVAVATVLLDRFVGLAGMAILAGAMLLAVWGSPQARRAAPAVAVTLAILAAASLVLFSRRVGRAVRLDALLDRLPRRENFRRAMDTLRSLPRSPAAAAVVAVMTVGVHVLLAAGIACMGASLRLPVPVHLYFVFVPVIYILAAVPVSIGGLGVVEGMYVVFFAASPGVEGSTVVALSLLARFAPMALSLPGLAFWLADRTPPPPARDAGDAPPATAPPSKRGV